MTSLKEGIKEKKAYGCSENTRCGEGYVLAGIGKTLAGLCYDCEKGCKEEEGLHFRDLV
jgi:hypothetical protein